MTSRGDERPAERVSYAEASRLLLRNMILDSMRDLLLARGWSSITVSDVARAAGTSRQTIYKEFGSRQGLALGYALRLADRFVVAIGDAMEANIGDVYVALLDGFRNFFAESASDPLVISLRTGAAKPDLLRIVTTDSGPIMTQASQALMTTYTQGWLKMDETGAALAARAIVRLGLSYASMPPEANHDVAADLARLLTPFFVERHGVFETN